VEYEHLRLYQQALSAYEFSRDYAVKVVEAQEPNGSGKVTESAMYQNASKSIMDIQMKVLRKEEEKSKKQVVKEQMDTMRFYKDKNHIKNID
jgi:hypothetical protein